MPDYLDLLTRRAKAENGAVGEVRFLADTERHAELNRAWGDATRKVHSLRAGVEQLQAAAELGTLPKQKMNAKSPIKVAEERADAAQQEADELKRQVQECFLVARFRAPNQAEIQKATSADGDIYDNLIETQLVEVATISGEPVKEITAPILVNFLNTAPAGVRLTITRWFDEAVQPVDYPM